MSHHSTLLSTKTDTQLSSLLHNIYFSPSNESINAIITDFVHFISRESRQKRDVGNFSEDASLSTYDIHEPLAVLFAHVKHFLQYLPRNAKIEFLEMLQNENGHWEKHELEQLAQKMDISMEIVLNDKLRHKVLVDETIWRKEIVARIMKVKYAKEILDMKKKAKAMANSVDERQRREEPSLDASKSQQNSLPHAKPFLKAPLQQFLSTIQKKDISFYSQNESEPPKKGKLFLTPQQQQTPVETTSRLLNTEYLTSISLLLNKPQNSSKFGSVSCFCENRGLIGVGTTLGKVVVFRRPSQETRTKNTAAVTLTSQVFETMLDTQMGESVTSLFCTTIDDQIFFVIGYMNGAIQFYNYTSKKVQLTINVGDKPAATPKDDATKPESIMCIRTLYNSYSYIFSTASGAVYMLELKGSLFGYSYRALHKIQESMQAVVKQRKKMIPHTFHDGPKLDIQVTCVTKESNGKQVSHCYVVLLTKSRCTFMLVYPTLDYYIFHNIIASDDQMERQNESMISGSASWLAEEAGSMPRLLLSWGTEVKIFTFATNVPESIPDKSGIISLCETYGRYDVGQRLLCCGWLSTSIVFLLASTGNVFSMDDDTQSGTNVSGKSHLDSSLFLFDVDNPPQLHSMETNDSIGAIKLTMSDFQSDPLSEVIGANPTLVSLFTSVRQTQKQYPNSLITPYSFIVRSGDQTIYCTPREGIVVLSPLNWKDRLQMMFEAKTFDLKEFLSLGRDLYLGEAKSVIGLSKADDERKRQVRQQMERFVTEYVAQITSESNWSEDKDGIKENLTLCIQLCIDVENQMAIFDKIFAQLVEEQHIGIFYDILLDNMREYKLYLPPRMLQYLFDKMQLLDRLVARKERSPLGSAHMPLRTTPQEERERYINLFMHIALALPNSRDIDNTLVETIMEACTHLDPIAWVEIRTRMLMEGKFDYNRALELLFETIDQEKKSGPEKNASAHFKHHRLHQLAVLHSSLVQVLFKAHESFLRALKLLPVVRRDKSKIAQQHISEEWKKLDKYEKHLERVQLRQFYSSSSQGENMLEFLLDVPDHSRVKYFVQSPIPQHIPMFFDMLYALITLDHQQNKKRGSSEESSSGEPMQRKELSTADRHTASIIHCFDTQEYKDDLSALYTSNPLDTSLRNKVEMYRLLCKLYVDGTRLVAPHRQEEMERMFIYLLRPLPLTENPAELTHQMRKSVLTRGFVDTKLIAHSDSSSKEFSSVDHQLLIQFLKKSSNLLSSKYNQLIAIANDLKYNALEAELYACQGNRERLQSLLSDIGESHGPRENRHSKIKLILAFEDRWKESYDYMADRLKNANETEKINIELHFLEFLEEVIAYGKAKAAHNDTSVAYELEKKNIVLSWPFHRQYISLLADLSGEDPSLVAKMYEHLVENQEFIDFHEALHICRFVPEVRAFLYHKLDKRRKMLESIQEELAFKFEALRDKISDPQSLDEGHSFSWRPQTYDDLNLLMDQEFIVKPHISRDTVKPPQKVNLPLIQPEDVDVLKVSEYTNLEESIANVNSRYMSALGRSKVVSQVELMKMWFSILSPFIEFLRNLRAASVGGRDNKPVEVQIEDYNIEQNTPERTIQDIKEEMNECFEDLDDLKEDLELADSAEERADIENHISQKQEHINRLQFEKQVMEDEIKAEQERKRSTEENAKSPCKVGEIENFWLQRCLNRFLRCALEFMSGYISIPLIVEHLLVRHEPDQFAVIANLCRLLLGKYEFKHLLLTMTQGLMDFDRLKTSVEFINLRYMGNIVKADSSRDASKRGKCALVKEQEQREASDAEIQYLAKHLHIMDQELSRRLAQTDSDVGMSLRKAELGKLVQDSKRKAEHENTAKAKAEHREVERLEKHFLREEHVPRNAVNTTMSKAFRIELPQCEDLFVPRTGKTARSYLHAEPLHFDSEIRELLTVSRK